MTDREMRQLLHRIIHDIDAGRIAPWRLGPRPAALGPTVLVAALGLAAGGCSGSKPPGPPPPEPTVIAPAPMYGVEPVPTDQQAQPGPYKPVDPGPVAEYMAPEPEPAPVDPGPRPMYGVPPRD